jgi:hypothetical protein
VPTHSGRTVSVFRIPIFITPKFLGDGCASRRADFSFSE